MKPKSLTQQYNDGVLSVYKVSNIAEAGNKPKENLTLKFPNKIPYEERIVGMKRFWTAMQEQTSIDLVLRVPRIDDIFRHDKVIPIDGKQYDIVQVQYPKDVVPPSIDLSLHRLEVAYEVN